MPVEISRYSFCVFIPLWSLQFLVRVFTFLSLILWFSYFGTFLSTWSLSTTMSFHVISFVQLTKIYMRSIVSNFLTSFLVVRSLYRLNSGKSPLCLVYFIKYLSFTITTYFRIKKKRTLVKVISHGMFCGLHGRYMMC